MRNKKNNKSKQEKEVEIRPVQGVSFARRKPVVATVFCPYVTKPKWPTKKGKG